MRKTNTPVFNASDLKETATDGLGNPVKVVGTYESPVMKITYNGPPIVAKPTNPKDGIGSDKLPLHLWPTTATALGSLGLLDGMLKYGRSNWRAADVQASIYYAAVLRHLNAWFETEDRDPDSDLEHFGHILANIAILVDATAAGTLIDDRMYAIKYREFIDKLTPHVKRLKAKYADRQPKHYTRADTDAKREPHE